MNSIDLFSGIGGLSLGLENAGFISKLVVESNSRCCDTFSTNLETRVTDHTRLKILNRDIQDMEFDDYTANIDLLAGGPPCQPFSLGGKHLGKDDERNMFPEAIRAVREVQPKAFLFENVRGINRVSFSEYFEYIKLQLTYPNLIKKDSETWKQHHNKLQQHHTADKNLNGLEYRVLSQVLNAADYGIPQRRERVFIVGFRVDVGASWNFPVSTHSRKALNESKSTGEYWDRYKVSKKHREPVHNPKKNSRKIDVLERKMLPWNTLRSAIADLPSPTAEIKKSRNFLNHEFHPGAKIYKGHTGSPLDEPSKTIKSGGNGVPGGENMLRRHDGSVRYFTIREAARLQGFTDDFRFLHGRSESMRQIGNAVPVELSTILSKSIFLALNDL